MDTPFVSQIPTKRHRALVLVVVVSGALWCGLLAPPLAAHAALRLLLLPAAARSPVPPAPGSGGNEIRTQLEDTAHGVGEGPAGQGSFATTVAAVALALVPLSVVLVAVALAVPVLLPPYTKANRNVDANANANSNANANANTTDDAGACPCARSPCEIDSAPLHQQIFVVRPAPAHATTAEDSLAELWDSVVSSQDRLRERRDFAEIALLCVCLVDLPLTAFLFLRFTLALEVWHVMVAGALSTGLMGVLACCLIADPSKIKPVPLVGLIFCCGFFLDGTMLLLYSTFPMLMRVNSENVYNYATSLTIPSLLAHIHGILTLISVAAVIALYFLRSLHALYNRTIRLFPYGRAAFTVLLVFPSLYLLITSLFVPTHASLLGTVTIVASLTALRHCLNSWD